MAEDRLELRQELITVLDGIKDAGQIYNSEASWQARDNLLGELHRRTVLPALRRLGYTPEVDTVGDPQEDCHMLMRYYREVLPDLRALARALQVPGEEGEERR